MKKKRLTHPLQIARLTMPFTLFLAYWEHMERQTLNSSPLHVKKWASLIFGATRFPPACKHENWPRNAIEGAGRRNDWWKNWPFPSPVNCDIFRIKPCHPGIAKFITSVIKVDITRVLPKTSETFREYTNLFRLAPSITMSTSKPFAGGQSLVTNKGFISTTRHVRWNSWVPKKPILC